MTRYAQAESREQAYRRNIRLATILALVLIAAGFIAVTPHETKPYALRRDADVLVIQPVSTNMYEAPRPQAVTRPKMPVPDPHGKATDSSVGQNTWDPFRPGTEPVTPKALDYYKVEIKPQPVHLEVPRYPELARQVGLEGLVTVKVLTDTVGGVSEVVLLASSGNSLLDEAAKEAAWKCRFTPGYQQGRPVPVWVAVPFRFRLQ